MSKQHCPVCGQMAVGRKAAKRVQKWVDESRLDRFMFDKLMLLAKAKMQDQSVAGFHPLMLSRAATEAMLKDAAVEAAKEKLVEAAEDLPVEKRTDEQGRPLPRKVLREQRHRRMDTLRNSNPLGWHAMLGGAELVRQPVSQTELPAPLAREAMLERDLHRARQREYGRRYYQKHKQRIDAQRKQRAAAKANGGRNDEA